MPPRTPVCPDCDVTLEGGFLLDETHGGKAQGRWIAGPPERSALTGLKTKGRRVLAVYAWRCPRCSLLRLYAPEV